MVETGKTVAMAVATAVAVAAAQWQHRPLLFDSFAYVPYRIILPLLFVRSCINHFPCRVYSAQNVTDRKSFTHRTDTHTQQYMMNEVPEFGHRMWGVYAGNKKIKNCRVEIQSCTTIGRNWTNTEKSEEKSASGALWWEYLMVCGCC